MTDIYKYWDTDQGFSDWSKPRAWENRFRSEKYFLEKIYKPGMSVLDVGCANGDLHLGLKDKFGDHEYVGTDISENMIKEARKFCPDANFFVGDISKEDFLGDRQFDLVTATGVFQHEPEYKKLLDDMLKHAKEGGYVLFDIKLFYDHPSISDITKSYCDLPDRLYFNVLNFQEALNWFKGVDDISSIEFFGYYSGTHKSVRLPESVKEEVCSAHVLLKKEKFDGEPKVSIELPEGFKL